MGPDGFDSWSDGPQSHKLSPSRAPQASSLRATASRGVQPHYIQRGSSPTDPEGSSPTDPEGFITLEGFIPTASRGFTPTLHPEGLIPHCIQRGSSPRGFIPLHPEGFPPPSLSCGYSGSSRVARAQELFQGLRERCSVQVRAGLPGKHLGRLFVRVRRILGSDKCSFPLGRSPSSHWQISWLFALIGKRLQPPLTSSAAEGWGWRRCQDKPPTPVGFGEAVYVSMLAKLLYYCLYFLPESKYS